MMAGASCINHGKLSFIDINILFGIKTAKVLYHKRSFLSIIFLLDIFLDIFRNLWYTFGAIIIEAFHELC